MPRNALLSEIQNLREISDRLAKLANEHSVVSDALLVIAGNVRQTAALLEVLLAVRIPPLDPA